MENRKRNIGNQKETIILLLVWEADFYKAVYGYDNKRIPVGPLMANCYIVGDALTKEVIIIDPGDEADKIFSVVEGRIQSS